MATSTLTQIATDGIHYMWDSFDGVLFQAGVANFFVVICIAIGVISVAFFLLRQIFNIRKN